MFVRFGVTKRVARNFQAHQVPFEMEPPPNLPTQCWVAKNFHPIHFFLAAVQFSGPRGEVQRETATGTGTGGAAAAKLLVQWMELLRHLNSQKKPRPKRGFCHLTPTNEATSSLCICNGAGQSYLEKLLPNCSFSSFRFYLHPSPPPLLPTDICLHNVCSFGIISIAHIGRRFPISACLFAYLPSP